VPVPKVDDEFSYLLAADTFAHGRLTNPAHPMWMHFETFHTIQQPSYASRYPPGQGLILALGQVLAHPVIGVWLSAALACAAICWMLMGWLTPPRWALIGGFLAILHPEILFWSQRYWGGSVTLAGGALALGGFRRLLSDHRDQHFRPRVRDAALMSVGMSILIICRPYEGGVLILILLTILIIALFVQKKRSLDAVMARVGWPIAVGLIITISPRRSAALAAAARFRSDTVGVQKPMDTVGPVNLAPVHGGIASGRLDFFSLRSAGIWLVLRTCCPVATSFAPLALARKARRIVSSAWLL